MELSVSGQRKRAVEVRKPPFANQSPAPKAMLKRHSADKLSLSQAALSFLQEADRQERENQRKLLESKQQGSNELDALTKSMKTMDKCRKIAARIQHGDRVPPEDERYLMDHDPDGYKLAIATRVPKEKPKEWDSVLEDEDREEQTASSVSSEEAPAEIEPEAGSPS